MCIFFLILTYFYLNPLRAHVYCCICSYSMKHTYTHTHTHTHGRSPLYEGSDSQRDLYLTTHNIHKRQISITSMGFDPVIPATEGSRSGQRNWRCAYMKLKHDVID